MILFLFSCAPGPAVPTEINGLGSEEEEGEAAVEICGTASVAFRVALSVSNQWSAPIRLSILDNSCTEQVIGTVERDQEASVNEAEAHLLIVRDLSTLQVITLVQEDRAREDLIVGAQ